MRGSKLGMVWVVVRCTGSWGVDVALGYGGEVCDGMGERSHRGGGGEHGRLSQNGPKMVISVIAGERGGGCSEGGSVFCI